MKINSSFSQQLPTLQLAIDSTSLGEFKTCPRKYYYRLRLGYVNREQSVHLTFGLLIHGSRERYDHAKATGTSHQQALSDALRWALTQTWNRKLGRPWISDHKLKNRQTLLRTIVWYLDQFGDNDPIKTVILANGKPAVELSFRFDTGYKSQSTGEPFVLCGHFDRLGELHDKIYLLDVKTTGYTISPSWFASFSPDNQFSTYTLAGKVAFSVPVSGLIVDGIQIAVGFSRCERALVPRDDALVEEWYAGLGIWLGHLEEYALVETVLPAETKELAWPMNDKACHLYGGCQYRPICTRTPRARPTALAADFKQEQWDPLQRRGDI